MVKNLFLEELAAVGYDKARPYFHPIVLERLSILTSNSGEASLSLDVGCGTGHSAEALSSVSTRVVGLDLSAAMLRQASARKSCSWVQGSAEELPFGSNEFNIVAAGLAFHWFDRITFLREAHRVLQAEGWLLIYNDWFCGTMHENPLFAEWNKQYLSRFSAPPRHSQPLSPEVFREIGFIERADERFAHAETYDIEQLVAYLKTQTNVISALLEGRETNESVSKWLRTTLNPLFTTSKCTFDYAGSLSLYEKAG